MKMTLPKFTVLQIETERLSIERGRILESFDNNTKKITLKGAADIYVGSPLELITYYGRFMYVRMYADDSHNRTLRGHLKDATASPRPLPNSPMKALPDMIVAIPESRGDVDYWTPLDIVEHYYSHKLYSDLYSMKLYFQSVKDTILSSDIDRGTFVSSSAEYTKTFRRDYMEIPNVLTKLSQLIETVTDTLQMAPPNRK